MSINKIAKILSKYKDKIKKTFNVIEIEVFGSYVRDEQTIKSDLDVLVEFDKIPGLIKFIKLENYLSNLLNVKVDLVRKKAVREELKGVIFKEAIKIW